MKKINKIYDWNNSELIINHQDLKQFIIESIKEINQGNYNDLSWNDNQDVHISEAFVLSNWLKYTFDITEEDLR